MAKKTREELAEIEYRALEEAMREMQALQEAEESSGTPGVEAAPAEPTLEKPKRTRKPRAKKEAASEVKRRPLLRVRLLQRSRSARANLLRKKRPLLRVRLLQRSRSAPGSPGRKQSFRTS